MPEQNENSVADLAIREDDRRAIQAIYEKLKDRSAQLVGPDGETRHLPNSVHAFLVDILNAISTNDSLLIIPNKSNLSTVQGAKLLGVSRQFFVNLLETGKMPSHKVGTHRRVYAKDLFRYKAERDGVRRKAIEDLGATEVADGKYDDMSMVDADTRQ
ncbi:MAG TPA: excisionase family DNA-binding protein [Candidatus Limnocylindrales bacterium]|nr:excisionase family DNA-binding protein [Candidatus Limnocylindrales bacterium]